ncbi:hypothetical protein PENSTE_c013G00182 [Penicillium steckii]|uniref:Uncharacterized protein n=1 Tax=Penicillium steckii TaxID=303698 RepID=A0A1V6T2D7_9EURO|nr:hypothetical protein PENSTE_c013G00182 [Penicillium steckii]
MSSLASASLSLPLLPYFYFYLDFSINFNLATRPHLQYLRHTFTDTDTLLLSLIASSSTLFSIFFLILLHPTAILHSSSSNFDLPDTYQIPADSYSSLIRPRNFSYHLPISSLYLYLYLNFNFYSATCPHD